MQRERTTTPPPPPSSSTTDQPTFAELATRLQALLVKTDPEIPPITVPPPIVGPAPPASTVNASALLNRSMQQLVVAALPLMRSPSSNSLSASTPLSRSSSCSSFSSPPPPPPVTPSREVSSSSRGSLSSPLPTPLSRRSSFTESNCSWSERGSFSEDTANWKDTWGSTASYDSLKSDSTKKPARGNSLLPGGRRFPGDSRVRSIRKPLDLTPSASTETEEHVYEFSKSEDHVVDVKPDPNDSP